MKSPTKFSSRKFILTCIQLAVTIILPAAYKLLGIPDNITMVCLTASAGLTAAYLGSNMMSKKNEPS